MATYNDIKKIKIGDNTFVFHVPTSSEVGAAASSHAHGNITSGGDITATAPTIASGDQIIINDHSASKITNGPTFDGSTTTTALTPKGTWESFSKFSGSYNDLTNKPTVPTITLNGSSTTSPSFYAPTDAGTSGYVLKSNGSGAPSWTSAVLTDEKLKLETATSTVSYKILLGTGTTAAIRQYDPHGLMYTPNYGTTTSDGIGYLTIGNSTPSGTANNMSGVLVLWGKNNNEVNLKPDTLTATRNILLPDKSGTIALTDDIPTIPSNNVTGTGSIDYLAKWSGTNTLSSSHLSISTSYNSSSDLYGKIKLYVGSTGQLDWQGQLVFYSGNTSKTITITPPSLATGSRTITLPDASGTVALTDDIPTVTDENVKSTAVTAATTNYLVGSTTSTTTTGGLSKHASGVLYTTADSGTSGYTQLRLGNTTATSSAGGKEGQIRLYGTNATYYLDLKPGAIASSNKTITFPNATGTVALTSDIPTVPTITLNGSSSTSPSFYAPTDAGTNGYVLKSNGSGAPTWASAVLTDEKLAVSTTLTTNLNYRIIFGSSTTTTAETKLVSNAFQYVENGANQVYLQLGNSSKQGCISFYNKSSYQIELIPDTLTTNRTITLPDKTGTVALTSDIPTVPTITLNGSSSTSPSFYAPTSAGTNGYVLKSNGSGAPSWTSATLTDTQVTVAENTKSTKYYPILATGTGTATRQIDTDDKNDLDASNAGLYYQNAILNTPALQVGDIDYTITQSEFDALETLLDSIT